MLAEELADDPEDQVRATEHVLRDELDDEIGRPVPLWRRGPVWPVRWWIR